MWGKKEAVTTSGHLGTVCNNPAQVTWAQNNTIGKVPPSYQEGQKITQK